ncbi:MAG: MFS transporter, partial [Rhodospirillales bacterium]|nr:MFS transporter [Rhodospirillales bacterium]
LAALALAGLINAWAILVLAFLLGSIESMATPARMTIAPNLVPKEDLSGAIALTAVSFNSATFIGPAFAGLAIAGIGAGWTFAIAAIAFTPHYLVLRRLKLSESEHVSGGGRSLVTDIYEALRYLFGHKGIAPILILALAGGVLVRHLPELMPGFAGDVFKGGPETLGALMSSFGVGGMCGSLWIANRNRIQGTTTIFFLGFIGNAAFVFAFAVTGHILIGMMAVAMFGFSMSTSGNCAQILIQSAVQGSMRARAMSLYSLTFRGAPALGAMLFGAFSVIYGLQAPVAIGASVSFILGSVIFLKYRARIRQLMETRTEDT